MIKNFIFRQAARSPTADCILLKPRQEHGRNERRSLLAVEAADAATRREKFREKKSMARWAAVRGADAPPGGHAHGVTRERFQPKMRSAANHMACRILEAARFFRSRQAGWRCAATSRFAALNGKTVKTKKTAARRGQPFFCFMFVSAGYRQRGWPQALRKALMASLPPMPSATAGQTFWRATSFHLSSSVSLTIRRPLATSSRLAISDMVE